MKTMMNVLNDQVLERVVGGNVTMFDAIDEALSLEGLEMVSGGTKIDTVNVPFNNSSMTQSFVWIKKPPKN